MVLATASRSRGAFRWALFPLLLVAGLAGPALAQAPADDDPAPALLAYWAFNDPGTTPTAWPPPIPADLGQGTITHAFVVQGNHGHGSFQGSNLNAQPGFPVGGSFVPQGSHNNGNHFTIALSTAGHENVRITYATQRSSTGFTSQAFAYSIDGGVTFVPVATVTDIPDAYVVRTVDFSAIEAVNDVADLRIRVTLDGATSPSGNNRVDNLTVTGTPIAADPEPAFVQVIHGSPDPAAAVVDVYVGPAELEAAAIVAGEPTFPNFLFRSATPFVQLAAGAYRVVITPPGGDAVLLNQVVELAPGLVAQAIALGVADPAAFPPNPDGRSTALTLLVNPDARRTAANTTEVDVTAVHGAPDAPTVAVRVGTTTLVPPFAYGDVSDVVAVPPGAVILDVTVGDEVVAQFFADLAPLVGQGVTVLATGFLAPPESAPGFGLLAVLADGTTVPLASPQEGLPVAVQLIHNAPDPAAAVVDVYVGDPSQTVEEILAGDSVFEGFAFRTATEFLEAPPTAFRFVITPAGDDTVLLDEVVELEEGATMQIIVSGVADPAAFPPNPDGRSTALTLLVNPDARRAATDAARVSVTAVHGAPDAPTVAVRAGTATLVPPFAYGDVSSVASVGATPVVLSVVAGQTEVVRFFADLTPLVGQAVTVLASGFLAPPEGAPDFGLLAVLADGTTLLLEAPPAVFDIATARRLPLGTEVTVEGVVSRARGAFTYLQDDTAGLTVRQTSGAFREAVNDRTIASGTRLRVRGVTSEFRGLFQINQADLRAFEVLGQGAPPEPAPVTLQELRENGEAFEARLVRVERVRFVGAPATFSAANTLQVTDDSIEGTFDFRVPNASDTDLVNQPVPTGPFTFTGVLGQFTPTTTGPPDQGYQLMGIERTDLAATALVQVIHNAPDPAFATVDVFVNGTRALDDFAFRTATPFLEVPTAVTVAVAPAGAESAEDAVFTQTYTLDPGVRYQLVALGLAGNADGPDADGDDRAFTLLVHPEARTTTAGDPEADVDLLVVHGAPDAPAVDVLVLAEQEASPLVEDLAYGGIAGYLTVPAATYRLGITPAGDRETIVAEFTAELTDAAGLAVTVLASGFLEPPESGAGFALLVVLPDGTTAVLAPRPVTAEPPAEALAFEVLGTYPNPFVTSTTLRYSLPVPAEVRVTVYDLLGRRVYESAPVQVGPGAGHTLALDAHGLAAGTYLWRLTAQTATGTLAQTGRMTVVR